MRPYQPLLSAFFLAALAAAQTANTSAKPAPELKPAEQRLPDLKPVEKTAEIQTGGRALKYKSTAGYLPVTNDNDEIEASLFYVAYTLEPATPAGQRPLTFCFNGGPGAGSVWLHLGAVGPKRVLMNEDGALPPPPYRLAANPYTWLDRTDLVFIDPVGTGFSRAKSAEAAKKFYSLRGDIDSVGQFIRKYLGRYQRWASPLFLAGESYGTTRAAGLAGHLVEKGVGLSGVILISTVLQFQTIFFARSNDLPYPLFLPTYTAIAWYHKKLAADMQKDLQRAIAESRRFAGGEYLTLLQKGDALTADERQNAAAQMARLTGLSRTYLNRSNLRVNTLGFMKELLRDEGRTVGRLDGRLLGTEPNQAADHPEFDPSLVAIRPPYTSVMSQYAREDLGVETDQDYQALNDSIGSQWDWGIAQSGGQGYADTSQALRAALDKNPHTKVFVGAGYYDLATPFLAAEYSLRHMGLDSRLKKNIRWAEYEGGHMMYTHVPSLIKLKKDIDDFYSFALKP